MSNESECISNFKSSFVYVKVACIRSISNVLNVHPFCIDVQILHDNDVIKNILTVTYMIYFIYYLCLGKLCTENQNNLLDISF